MSSTDSNPTGVARKIYNRKLKRYVAFKLKEDLISKEVPGKTWHVGLSFGNHLALDLDDVTEQETVDIARYYALMLKGRVAVFWTFKHKHYWIVCDKDLTWGEYRDAYGWAISTLTDKIDLFHAYLSLKHKKTTLRLDEKEGRTHKLLTVV